MNQSQRRIANASGVGKDVERYPARTTYPSRLLCSVSDPLPYVNAANTDISVHLKRYKAQQPKQLRVAGSKK